MHDGHACVWTLLVGTVISIAVTLDDPLVLIVLLASLLVTGFIVRGPRVASFVTGACVAFGCGVIWMFWMLLAPGGATGSAVLFEMPTLAPGPGVRLGGTVSVAALESASVSALASACVAVAAGLAGQLVSARGWLSLARTVLGPLAPAVGWLASAGEATAEVASRRRQRRGRRGTPGLTTWVRAYQQIARDMPGVSPRVLLAWRASDLAHLLAAVALLAAWLLAPTLGALPVAAAGLLVPLSVALPLEGRSAAHA